MNLHLGLSEWAVLGPLNFHPIQLFEPAVRQPIASREGTWQIAYNFGKGYFGTWRDRRVKAKNTRA